MSNASLELFNSILVKEGYRQTKARSNTFLLLLNSEPLSINQLIQKAGSKIDRVSIYRNISLFEKLGIVHRVYVGWRYKIELSDDFLTHHHHLCCLNCGKILDIEDEAHIDSFIKDISAKHNFQAKRHHFEIDGYCQNCAK